MKSRYCVTKFNSERAIEERWYHHEDIQLPCFFFPRPSITSWLSGLIYPLLPLVCGAAYLICHASAYAMK